MPRRCEITGGGGQAGRSVAASTPGTSRSKGTPIFTGWSPPTKRGSPSFPAWDLIPQQWLHLTIQGVGFTDETAADDVDRIVEATSALLRTLDPPQLGFQQAVVLPEAVALPPSPDEDVRAIRTALRAGIADVWGDDRIPENADTFRPHVSVAYNDHDRTAGEIVQAIEALAPPPATITVKNVDLIILGRDQHLYRWRRHARLPLGQR